jgi:polyferredoxin
MCVQACPTGIDIRAGLQMECIACTACIDACDTIMDKVHKPRGLIRYGSEDNSRIQFLRGRFLAYMGIFIVLLSGFILLLKNKTEFFVEVLRQRGTPYLVLGKGDVQNQFYVRLINQTTQPQRYTLSVSNPEHIELIYPEEKKLIYPQQDIRIPLFIRIKPSLPRSGGSSIHTDLFFHLGSAELKKEITLILPQQEKL